MVWIGPDRSRPTWKSKWDAKRDTRISFLLFVLLKWHLWRALAFSLVKKSLLQASKKLLPSLLENFSHSPLHSDFSILHSSYCSAVMMRSLDGCIWPRVWWALQESQTPAPVFFFPHTHTVFYFYKREIDWHQALYMDDHNKSNNDCNCQTWNTLILCHNIDIQSSNPPL